MADQQQPPLGAPAGFGGSGGNVVGASFKVNDSSLQTLHKTWQLLLSDVLKFNKALADMGVIGGKSFGTLINATSRLGIGRPGGTLSAGAVGIPGSGTLSAGTISAGTTGGGTTTPGTFSTPLPSATSRAGTTPGGPASRLSVGNIAFRAGAATFAVTSLMGGYLSRNLGDIASLNYAGNQFAQGATGGYSMGTQNNVQRYFSGLGGYRNTSDLLTGAATLAPFGGSYGTPRFSNVMQRAGAFSSLNPAAGFGGAAGAMANMYAPETNYSLISLGMGSSVGAGGSLTNPQKVAQNILMRIFRGRMWTAKDITQGMQPGAPLAVSLSFLDPKTQQYIMEYGLAMANLGGDPAKVNQALRDAQSNKITGLTAQAGLNSTIVSTQNMMGQSQTGAQVASGIDTAGSLRLAMGGLSHAINALSDVIGAGGGALGAVGVAGMLGRGVGNKAVGAANSILGWRLGEWGLGKIGGMLGGRFGGVIRAAESGVGGSSVGGLGTAAMATAMGATPVYVVNMPMGGIGGIGGLGTGVGGTGTGTTAAEGGILSKLKSIIPGLGTAGVDAAAVGGTDAAALGGTGAALGGMEAGAAAFSATGVGLPIGAAILASVYLSRFFGTKNPNSGYKLITKGPRPVKNAPSGYNLIKRGGSTGAGPSGYNLINNSPPPGGAPSGYNLINGGGSTAKSTSAGWDLINGGAPGKAPAGYNLLPDGGTTTPASASQGPVAQTAIDRAQTADIQRWDQYYAYGGNPYATPRTAYGYTPMSVGGGADTGGRAAPANKQGGPIQVSGNSPGAVAIRSAEKELGVPYVYGAESPGHGFDCSGLTQWAYRTAGIDLPRTAAEQQSATGPPIPAAQAMAGDLVTFGDPATHVALYVGQGKMIAAPHTGTSVQIQPVYQDQTQYHRVRGAGNPSVTVNGSTTSTTGTSTSATTTTDSGAIAAMFSGTSAYNPSAEEVDVLSSILNSGGTGSPAGSVGATTGTTDTTSTGSASPVANPGAPVPANAKTLSQKQIYSLLLSTGFNKDEARIMSAISMVESGGRSGAFNGPMKNGHWLYNTLTYSGNSTGDDSYGLFQINMAGAAGGPTRRQWFGLAPNASQDTKLLDPAFNAHAAYVMFQHARFAPWGPDMGHSGYSDGSATVYPGSPASRYMNSYAVGHPKLEQDEVAHIHRGEMVMPEDLARQFRSFIGAPAAVSGSHTMDHTMRTMASFNQGGSGGGVVVQITMPVQLTGTASAQDAHHLGRNLERVLKSSKVLQAMASGEG